jgi:hypothetical protein
LVQLSRKPFRPLATPAVLNMLLCTQSTHYGNRKDWYA